MAILVQHTFTAANSTNTIPAANTGQTATVASGTWGINANRAYVSGGTTGLIHWETGVSDSSVSADIIWQSNGGIATRLTDANNFIFIRINSSSLALFKNVAGTATSLGSYTFTPVVGTSYNVKITTQGTGITVYLNGTSVISVTETFNQTATKAGLREGTTTTSYYDNFLVESLGATGTDGSTAFDLRQTMYVDSSVNADVKQSLYSDASALYDSYQTIYSDSATEYDTRLTLYQDGSTLYDTLQEFFSDGIVGSTPFDIRMVLYADSSAVFDNMQSWYTDGVSSADLAQQFYETGEASSDVKLVIYADALTRFDASQSLYTDTFVKADTVQRYYTEGIIDFDTLQAILEDWAQYNEVIRIVLNITRSQTATLGITQHKQSELNL